MAHSWASCQPFPPITNFLHNATAPYACYKNEEIEKLHFCVLIFYIGILAGDERKGSCEVNAKSYSQNGT
jgi:hypothetical protein